MRPKEQKERDQRKVNSLVNLKPAILILTLRGDQSTDEMETTTEFPECLSAANNELELLKEIKSYDEQDRKLKAFDYSNIKDLQVVDMAKVCYIC